MTGDDLDPGDVDYGYVCEGCQTTTKTVDNKTVTVPVDKERRGLNSRGTAEALATAHRVKTGHSPEVKRFA